MVRENFHTHSLAAVDLGCGKGGDLLKWTKSRHILQDDANIGHLICVDIAETSVRQCKERYEFNKQKRFGAPRFSAEFIVADCTKTSNLESRKDTVCFQSLLGDPTRRVHIVSCQFAFHYCFESLQQAETMVKNAASNLATGGFFLLTIPDANYIMKKLSSEKSNAFGNEVFRIEFPDDRPEVPLLFGDRYQFFLEGAVDCPEFLVHQPTLKSFILMMYRLCLKLCLKYGLECVYQKRFSDVYKDAMQDEQSRMLLQKMSALEPYPSPSGTQSSSNSQEYVAACEHLKQQQSDSNVRPCTLTLSASEWQATSKPFSPPSGRLPVSSLVLRVAGYQ
ncbi:hypothetical protein HAZT_HAZT008182 [Hyalella azteca]|uniref:mRNA (guanine-N(7))-methyltransferase n=1 Tax=Hyalella azteca TaxID=294128 RepID=A0A6A0GSP8_HYAAZ|nr:hypothetical protein HAZT_HAZT008182 [Hyalella azteca]